MSVLDSGFSGCGGHRLGPGVLGSGTLNPHDPTKGKRALFDRLGRWFDPEAGLHVAGLSPLHCATGLQGGSDGILIDVSLELDGVAPLEVGLLSARTPRGGIHLAIEPAIGGTVARQLADGAAHELHLVEDGRDVVQDGLLLGVAFARDVLLDVRVVGLLLVKQRCGGEYVDVGVAPHHIEDLDGCDVGRVEVQEGFPASFIVEDNVKKGLDVDSRCHGVCVFFIIMRADQTINETCAQASNLPN